MDKMPSKGVSAAARCSTRELGHMDFIAAIERSWSWIGLRPHEVIGENDFGNLIIKADDGCYWRLCPEELSCKIIARTRAEFDSLFNSQEFLGDWKMSTLVKQAEAQCGALTPGRKYCLKTPAVLGGEYSADNFATIQLNELICASGDMAHQTKDVPDGGKVTLVVTK
jgi:hypothetical protein